VFLVSVYSYGGVGGRGTDTIDVEKLCLSEQSSLLTNARSVALLVTADDVSLSFTPGSHASMGEIKSPGILKIPYN
jgi:hypothetical protein